MKHLKSISEFQEFNESVSLINKIKKNLTPDLLKGSYKNSNPQNYSGYCYVATEAFYWMMGGPQSEYYPCVLGHKDWPEGLDKGKTHWFLKNRKTGKVVDITKEQFDLPIPYNRGISNGMMNYPVGGSKRCRILIDRIT